jgi:hypothetical protein
VNNAGFGAYGEFRKARLDRLMEMTQVNVTAVVHMTHLYLPGMIARGSGDILIVASTAAFQAVPYISTYAATKVFDLHFAEGLAEEVRQYGVRVCALCPGSTETEFFQVAGQRNHTRRAPETAEKVARVGLAALAAGLLGAIVVAKLDLRQSFAVATAGSLLVAPHVNVHDLSLLLIPGLLLFSSRQGRSLVAVAYFGAIAAIWLAPAAWLADLVLLWLAFQRSGRVPRFTRWSIHRKYPAVRIVPTPPAIMKPRYRPMLSPAAGLNAPSSDITSPQKPARPGSPSEAIATKAKMPASFGIVCPMPPPIVAMSRVW